MRLDPFSYTQACKVSAYASPVPRRQPPHENAVATQILTMHLKFWHEKTESIYPTFMDSKTIRLLRFSQKRDGSFKGELRAFPLNEAPPFNTASYVWGMQTHSATMTFESTSSQQSLPVLSSLAPFLAMVSQSKDFGEKDWWWIDSICINLDDKLERGAQVKIMGDIYRKARRTIVWLGEEKGGHGEGNCAGAVEFLCWLGEMRSEIENDNATWRSRLRGAVTMPRRIPNYAAEWRAVGLLLSRAWWTRVWTLQEFILPSEVKFYCDSHSISRSRFRSAMYSIYLLDGYDNNLFPRAVFDAAWNRRRILQWYNETTEMSLVALLAYLGNHAATDARDRVYSVLGLISERGRGVVGIPEYSCSVEQLYARLVRCFWDEYGRLDIVCFVHMFNRDSKDIPKEESEGMLPSWAPDWRTYVQSSPVPLMASQSARDCIGNFRPLHSKTWSAIYNADEVGKELKSKAEVRFHKNLKEMWADGVIIDEIGGLGGLEGCETRCRSLSCEKDEHTLMQADRAEKESQEEKKDALEVLTSVARSLVLDRKDKYLRFRAPKHYVSDFLVLCNAYLNGSNVDPLFVTWFNENKSLLIDDRTLVSVINEVISSSESSTFSSLPPPTIRPSSAITPHSDSANEDDSFLERFHDTVRKKSRRLMVTREGHIGTVSCRARQGDVIAILLGCSIPLVLRKVGTREAWKVVGEAYVHRFMNGEIGESVTSQRRTIRTFRLV